MTWTFALRTAAAAALAIGVTASAVGQDDRRWDGGEATIYRNAGYSGSAVTIRDENPDLRLAWRVSSVRIRAGRWELCERAFYRGSCRTLDRDTPLLSLRGLEVQSVRRVDIGWSPTPEQPMVQDQTVRGNFAQFHTAPTLNGRRVLACERGNPTAACAAQEADRFCRTNGWNGSAREHLETVGRRIFLADVLCVRSAY